MVDLCYAEDSIAEVDMNVVMTGMADLLKYRAPQKGCLFRKTVLICLSNSPKKVSII